LRAEGEQLLDHRRELLAQQLVRLVHDEHLTPPQVGDALSTKIQDTSGRSD